MDYLGEIVAGSDLGYNGGGERSVTCLHLTVEDIKRIPEFELRNFRDVIHNQNFPFMQIGARKCRMNIEDL